MVYDYIKTEGNVQVMHKLLFSLIEFAREVEKHTKEGWQIDEQYPAQMIGFNYGLWMTKPLEEVKAAPVEVKSEEPARAKRGQK